jgi:hypothetical protein
LNHSFKKFDYGLVENLKVYGQVNPPNYPLSNITSKNIALFRGLNDLLADNTDVNLLVRELKGAKFFNLMHI